MKVKKLCTRTSSWLVVASQSVLDSREIDLPETGWMAITKEKLTKKNWIIQAEDEKEASLQMIAWLEKYFRVKSGTFAVWISFTAKKNPFEKK